MALRSFALQDFRNHQKIHLDLNSGITVVTGPNGIGKTSLLEAISLLGSGKSFRLAKNKDFVKFNSPHAILNASIDHFGLQSQIRMEILPTSKRIQLNGKACRQLRRLHEILPFVVFSPHDHRIVEGDASERRHFLSQALSSYDHEYADILSEYTHTLTQRNKLLKELRELPNGWQRLNTELEIWDMGLAKSGSLLLEKRSQYIADLSKLAAKEYNRISGKTESFAIQYRALGQEIEEIPWEKHEDRVEHLLRRWKDSMRLDFASGTTHIGPHKDDLCLTLDANEVKFYGSQGEKRTGVLALRLAEVDLLRKKEALPPVLLVDDVSSELDSVRRQALVELLRQEDLQVLLTSTELPSALVDAMERPYEHLDLGKFGVGEK